MKRLSVKLKVTFWFALMMTLIVIASLAFIFDLGEKIVYEKAHDKLKNTVTESFDEIRYRFGNIDIDDLDYYNEGVYIAVYHADGSLIYGRLPSGFDRSLPFAEEQITTVGEGEHAKYVYDLTKDIGRGHYVTVRGVLSASGSELAFSALIKIALIMFPALILIASIVGYLITRRAFRPIKKIAEAAENINNGNDLTKRIGLGNGNDEIHKLGKEIDLMLNRLQESFENEKRFTSDASHELRTPMSVIIAQTESALNNPNTQGESREAFEVIHDKATEMSELISSLLLLARADKGHFQIRKERINLSELIEIVSGQSIEIAKDKGITVSSEIEHDIYVIGDDTMLIRMMLNLCENGIKYGKKDGKLIISLTRENNYAICKIIDDGIGIAEENLERIFDRFFREDEARSFGSGLGLPLAKYICKAHGGEINAQSVYGSGSIFAVFLPITE